MSQDKLDFHKYFSTSLLFGMLQKTQRNVFKTCALQGEHSGGAVKT